jgi:hypothetical protein
VFARACLWSLTDPQETSHNCGVIHRNRECTIPKHRLGAGYGRKKFKNGGVSILIREDLNFTNINLQKLCKERDIEIVAIQLKLNGKKVIILSIYRAPVGDYDYF